MTRDAEAPDGDPIARGFRGGVIVVLTWKWKERVGWRMRDPPPHPVEPTTYGQAVALEH